MSIAYQLVHRATRRGPLKQAVRAFFAALPDVRVTRSVPHLGQIRLSVRRQHWLMGRDNFEGHRRIFGMFAGLIRPGDTFYEVGANTGYYARFVLHHLPVGSLVAFEPMAGNLDLLRRNLELGRFAPGRWRVEPVALSDEDGTADLQVDDVADGSAVLDRLTGGAASGGRAARGLGPKVERVSVRRLDSLVAEDRLPPPGVMKVDTEGAEALVFAGATETLRAHRPRLVIATHGPDKVTATIRTLEPLGYQVWGYAAVDGGEVYRRLSIDDADALADNNLIASTDEADVREPIEPIDLSTCPMPEP